MHGIEFWMKSNVGVSVEFPLTAEELPPDGVCTTGGPHAACSDAFSFQIPASPDWKHYVVPFVAFHSKTLGPFSRHARSFYGINFQVSSDALFDVWVDDIQFTEPQQP
jgi:hypothetical protein